MRYLGVDYGAKRVGVAISDEGGTIAFPYAILESGKGLVGEVKTICAHESVETIVVGESTDYQGKSNAIMEGINRFVKELRDAVHVPLVYEREFLSTQQARFHQAKKKRVDDSAAAIILQSYLDKKNNKSILEN
ncbi:MAG: hypothetical protein UY07_C0048G0012 [Parcubacteria group bacterium GW2011_GWA1_47_8]|nr:MAG: hypothetical protein UY07_C0048G0012 [Parcubacteria group bacterium GW2011_GWA1_47_8]